MLNNIIKRGFVTMHKALVLFKFDAGKLFACLFILMASFTSLACSSPLIGKTSGASSDLTLTFIIAGTSANTENAKSSASRLLLPNAKKLVVNLTPSDANLKTPDALKIPLTGLSSVPAVFENVVHGEYTVKADAFADDGSLLFTQKTIINVSGSENKISLNLIPVAPEAGFPLLDKSQILPVSLNAGEAKTFLIPSDSLGMGFFEYSVPSSVEVYVQTKLDGRTVSKASKATISNASGDYFFTIYNPTTSAVSFDLNYNAASVQVSFSLSNNQALVFTPGALNAKASSPITLTTNTSLTGFSAWTWRLDGLVNADNTGSTFTWTPTEADVGNHVINLTVEKDGLTWSGELTLIVESAISSKYSILYSRQGTEGGTAPIDSNRYASGSSALVLGNTGNLTKTQNGIALRFTSWNTKLDGTGSAYLPNTTITMTENITLYAQWEVVIGPSPNGAFTINFAFVNNTLTFAPASLTLVAATPVTIKTTETGYSNFKWYRDSLIDATNTSAEYTWTPEANDIGHHVLTLTAVKNGITYSGDLSLTVTSENRQSYSVIYSSVGTESGNAPIDAAAYYQGSNATVLGNTGPLVKMQDGISMRFVGWATTPTVVDGETLYGPNTVNTTIPVNANVYLYPRWTVIGGIGPAGGWVFRDQGFVQDGWRYMEASPEDLAKSGVPWAETAVTVSGTTDNMTPASWQSNTEKILMATATAGQTGNNAARLCSNYSYGGYSDWALPAPNELARMCSELHKANPSIGNFTNQWYWSSEVNDVAGKPIFYDFLVPGAWAGQVEQNNTTLAVRAVRAFKSANQTYTVTYNKNGADAGFVPVDVVGYEAGDTVTVKGDVGSLTYLSNWTLMYWNTQADGFGEDYGLSGATFIMPAKNVTLYAKLAK